VAKTPRQHGDGAGSCDVFLLADNYPQLTVEHEERLIVTVMDMDRAGVAAPGEGISHGEGPAGLFAAEAHLGQGAQEPGGRLGVRAGDHTGGHGRTELGHGWGPSGACGALAGRRAQVQPTAPDR
jgi:hypothetical protein